MTDLAVRPSRLDPLWSLTARERDVLALLAEGQSNVGIARYLGVTTRTIESHTSSIFNKLGLRDTVDTHRRVQAAVVHLRANGVGLLGA